MTVNTKDANTLGKSNYLKHVLDKDDKVIESYACAILKGNEYCIRGGKDNFTGNTLLLKQLDDAKIEGISCIFAVNFSKCEDAPVDLTASSNGNVSAFVYGDTCDVNDAGSSSCEG